MILEEKERDIRALVEELYQDGWDAGFDGQVLMRPDVVFDRWVKQFMEKLEE